MRDAFSWWSAAFPQTFFLFPLLRGTMSFLRLSSHINRVITSFFSSWVLKFLFGYLPPLLLTSLGFSYLNCLCFPLSCLSVLNSSRVFIRDSLGAFPTRVFCWLFNSLRRATAQHCFVITFLTGFPDNPPKASFFPLCSWLAMLFLALLLSPHLFSFRLFCPPFVLFLFFHPDTLEVRI